MKKRISPMSRQAKHSLAVAVASSLSAFAVAEPARELPTAQAQAQTEESYKTEESTSHKYTQPLLDTAKTITVIPQAVMKDRGVESLRDALRSVSGISLAAGEGGTPTGDSMSIRGFSARTDIFVDGVRDIASYTRDTYNIEAVEVGKGPSAAVNGRGSTGGSINMQTKTAALENASDVALRVGSEGDYRINVDTNMAVGTTSALRVNLLSEDSDVAGRDEVYNKSQGLAASFATGLGTARRFNINGEIYSQDNLPDYGIPWVGNGQVVVPELAGSVGGPPPVEFSNFYGNVYRDYEDVSANSVTAKFEQDLGTNTTLRILGRVGKVERESIVSAPRFIDIDVTTDVRLSDEKTRDQENSLQVLQADLLGTYQMGGIEHSVVAGVEVASEVEKRWTFDDNGTDNLDTTPEVVDLYNPDAYVTYNGVYERVGSPTEANGDSVSFYVFDTLTFNPQWELSLGLRSETFDTKYYYDSEDPSVVAAKKDNLLSWSTSVVFKPVENASIYLGAGNSFNPSAEDLTASTRSNSNQAELDPEETTSLELGTKWDLLDGKLGVNAALFVTRKDKARTDDPDFTGTESGYDTLNGEQRVKGFEFSATGQINDAWLVIGSYTYQDGEVTHAEGDDVDQIGLELARTPRNSASLWTRYDFSSQWAAGLGWQYIDEQYNSTSYTGRETAPSYSTFDMMVSFDLNEHLSFQLNGTNITDEEYVDQLGGGHFIPGEGQYFRLSGRYTF